MLPPRKKSGQIAWHLDRTKYLDEHELRKLLKTAAEEMRNNQNSGKKTTVRDWFLITVATETGLRVQEIADLNCGDLVLQYTQPYVVVRNGKGGKRRIVHIRDEFRKKAEQFLSWKQTAGECTGTDDPLFNTNGNHTSKRALQKAYKRSLASAGITQAKGIGIHSLRHTYASFLLKASNANLRLVQDQLGHSSITTTQVYAHIFNPEIQQALRRLYA